MATAVSVTTVKAAQVAGAKAGLEIVEREIPEAGPAEVRIKVQGCGVCRNHALVLEGSWPGIPYPRVPGHEVAGDGCYVGTPADTEDTLRFAELCRVYPMIETYPLEEAAEAYARMMSGKAQFRVVLRM